MFVRGEEHQVRPLYWRELIMAEEDLGKGSTIQVKVNTFKPREQSVRQGSYQQKNRWRSRRRYVPQFLRIRPFSTHINH